jgi:hypothetical protein
MLPALMLGDYSTSVSSTPSCFLRRTDLLGNPFLITSLLDLLFLSFLFWIIIQVLTVDYRIKVHLDLQADKSSVVVKGPFFP